MKATKIEDYTDDEILRDGESIKIPMVLMDGDGVQRAVARSQVTDYAAHRPGYRTATPTIRDDIGGDELDVEARRHLKRMSDPKLSPYDRRAAANALRDYLVQNYGDDEGISRYSFFAKGLNLDAREMAFADYGRRICDAWKPFVRDVGPAAAADKEEADEERLRHQRDASPQDRRAAAYADLGCRLADGYKQPFRGHLRDDMLMQAGYHPNVPLEYQHRDLRSPKAESGGPDSEAAYQASKIAASNAWRTYDPHHPPALASSSMHERFDPAPGGGAYNESKIAAARSRKEEKVSVSREDYIRRTRTAWDPTAATGIEAQREKWLGK